MLPESHVPGLGGPIFNVASAQSAQHPMDGT